ncbi:MAG: hypothetical protein JNL84_00045 [Candidatus Accumulibacter sp.]|nr:hypothetical protein [Accumulibacter sp.]
MKENTAALLLLDWLPVDRDDEMRQRLIDLSRTAPPQIARIILTSWQPPGTFEDSVKGHRLGDLRRLHKPLRWEDVLPDEKETANRNVKDLMAGASSARAITPPRRRRLIHAGEGRYRVHPADMNKAAFWPLPRFSEDEIDRLMHGHAVKLHRGWLPWSTPNTAMGWYQLVTVAHRWRDGQKYPELLWQYAIAHPEPWQTPMPGDAIDNLFKLMAEVGFHRGRHYEIDQLPDAEQTPFLQLTRANHPVYYEMRWQPSDQVLPVAKPLTGGLLDRAKQFISDYKNPHRDSDPLTYVVRAPCGMTEADDHSLDTQFWSELVGTSNLSAMLEIPVYRKQPQQDSTNLSADLKSLLGWMIFDRLPNSPDLPPDQVYATAASDLEEEKAQIEERVKIVETLVLQAIEQIREEKEKRRSRHSEEQNKQLKKLRQGLGWAGSRDEREKALVDFAWKAGGLDQGSTECSVVFARHDAATKSLTITVDTTRRLLGQDFPVSSRFALAACARSKKLFVVPNWRDLPEDNRITPADWRHLPDMNEEKARDLFEWAKNEILTTVALPVLSKGNSLLGVLLEQHKRPYHFSRERIDNLQAQVDTALLYLELDAARATADTWDGAVMHEIRSGIQDPYQSLNKLLKDPALSETLRQAIRGTLYDIEDLRDLSNAFLENIGNNDKRTRSFVYHSKTGGSWFSTLDDYGRHRAAAWAEYKTWSARFSPEGQEPGPLSAPDKLIRVVRILLDNAFRYGKIDTPVELAVSQGQETVKFWVTSGGEFSESIRQGSFRNASERLDLGGRALRTHLGLSLANALIREQGQQLRLNNEANHSAVASFTWPLASATSMACTKENEDGLG